MCQHVGGRLEKGPVYKGRVLQKKRLGSIVEVRWRSAHSCRQVGVGSVWQVHHPTQVKPNLSAEADSKVFLLVEPDLYTKA